jgi:two-component system OmpR family response regulator
MRVLVIEDDRETALFLQRSLKENGHVTDIAADGETGLALAREGGWDVIIKKKEITIK